MRAVANSPKFAKKVGVNQSIGREFTQEKEMKKVKKMQMGGRTMADRAGAQAMDPRMAMAMEDQRRRAAAGGMKKGGKLKRKKHMDESGQPKKLKRGGNTSRMNNLEELGRVDAEKGYTKKGKKNLKSEKKRLVSQIKKGYREGGTVEQQMKKRAAQKTSTPASKRMSDKEGRALSMDKKGMTIPQMKDARGRAMATGGMLARTGGSSAKMKAKGKGMQGYNARLDDSLGARHGKKKQSLKSRRDESKGAKKAAGKKAYSGNRKSAQGRSSASKRADGIAQQGHTRGRHV